jgi:uncharacterized protein (TIGR04255 family)
VLEAVGEWEGRWAVYEPLVRPPLVEAVCEFRFDPSAEWDWTIPGRLYDRIGDEFPRREQVQGIGFQLQLGEGPQPTIPAVQGGVDRVLMSREDGSALVQVGPNHLVVNHKLPYPGWAGFFMLIERILGMYLHLVPSSAQRVGLRYINQIPGPFDGSVEIGSLITLDPPIPPEIARPLLNFYQRYELRHDDPEGVLIHQTGMQLTPENEMALMLDLDFGSLPGSAPDVSEAGPWLQAAHDRVEDAFQASVNPKLLERMRRGD